VSLVAETTRSDHLRSMSRSQLKSCRFSWQAASEFAFLLMLFFSCGGNATAQTATTLSQEHFGVELSALVHVQSVELSFDKGHPFPRLSEGCLDIRSPSEQQESVHAREVK
jgi:hypothetical protein